MQSAPSYAARCLLVACLLVSAAACGNSSNGSSSNGEECEIPSCKLSPSDAGRFDRFGTDVAIDDDALIVGSEFFEIVIGNTILEAGATYVYRFDGTEWGDEEQLLPADARFGDLFGSAVALSGDVAVVGSPLSENAPFQRNFDQGGVYVFRYDGTNWSQEDKFATSRQAGEPLDALQYDFLGYDVSVSGDVVVAGAPGKDVYGTGAGLDFGAAFVYRHNGTSWAEDIMLEASDGAAGDEFGSAVSVSGDVIAVSAAANAGGGTSNGAVYVYRYDGSDWNEEQKLVASDPGDSQRFGRSVEVKDDVIVVGAHQGEVDGDATGAAYVFRYVGMTWVEEQKLSASDADTDDQFGNAVSMVDDVIVVGAPGNTDQGAGTGSAYVFEYDGTDWAEAEKLVAVDAASADLFGISVATSDAVIVVGAPGDGPVQNGSGSAYLFDQ